MIGAATTLDYATFCKTFHATLGSGECRDELEKLAEIKQKPFMAPNLEDSWVYKTYKWKWTFGNPPMTEKTYDILKFFSQKINALLSSNSEQSFKLNYTVNPVDESLQNLVYIPDGKYMPKKLGGGIDAEMFDHVILPCLQKTLAKMNIACEFSIGKVYQLTTYAPKTTFGKADSNTEILQTVETVVKMHIIDGFTKVNREDKKARSKASFTGTSKSSPEQLKIVQVWHRQHATAVPEHIQKALTELKVK